MPLIVCDTETGGFYPDKNALLSFAAVELAPDLTPTDRRLHLFLKPEDGFSVEEGAARVNGYTPEKWAERKAIPMKEAFQQIADWMPEKAEPIAHYAEFDRAFVQFAELRTGISTKLPKSWWCSCERFRMVNRVLRLGARDHKLGTLAKLSGYVWGTDGAHSALEDSLAAAHGWRWLHQRMTPPAQAAKP